MSKRPHDTQRYRWTDATRLHHLRQLARKTARVARSRSVSRDANQVAGHNLETLNWAITIIERLAPELDEAEPSGG